MSIWQYMMNKRPVGEQECRKFSSTMFSYSDQAEYDRLASFLAKSEIYKVPHKKMF